MSFTLREFAGRAHARLILVLTLVIGFLTVTGPFGTFDAMGIGARAVYWAAIVGAAAALRWAFIWAEHRMDIRGWLPLRGLDLVYAALLAFGILGANAMLFGHQVTLGGYATMFVTVLAITLLIVAAIFLIEGRDDADQTAPDGLTQFMRRLPIEKRGTLIRIAAEDHYLKVVTDRGEAMILMRLADAEAELGPSEGLRVHRSHWIAPNAVVDAQRYRGQLRLTLSDGVEVPVSRSHADAVIAAGLI